MSQDYTSPDNISDFQELTTEIHKLIASYFDGNTFGNYGIIMPSLIKVTADLIAENHSFGSDYRNRRVIEAKTFYKCLSSYLEFFC